MAFIRTTAAARRCAVEQLESRVFFAAATPVGFAGTADSIVYGVVAAAAVTSPTVSATKVTTTSMQVNWSAPPVGQQVAKYIVKYTPGAWAPGTAGQTLTKNVAATATHVTISGLLPFTLYSINVSAVDSTGRSATTHINTWTSAPAADKRYLYVVRLPKTRQGFTNHKPHIEVFDVANGHKWVKNIPLPSGIYAVRGVAANIATQKLFVGFFNTPADTYQTGGLLCIDLKTSKVDWLKRFPKSVVPSPDRFDITPDGSKIYMPVGEHGPDNFWVVLDARTGNALGRIAHVTAPHNTIVSVDGKLAFLEGQEKGTQPLAWKHTIGVVDTATNTVIKRVGPFRDVVRPFTINGKGSLIFATVNNFVGFQVGDVASGKVIYTIAPTGYVQPNPPLGRALSHGIAMTPDEKFLFVVDGLKVGVHAWDISKTPSQAPKYLGFIKTRYTGKNLAGLKDPSASQDTNGVPAWLTVSWDGKFLYPESGEIIDIATRKVVGQLRAKTTNSAGSLVDAPYTHSRFNVEIHFDPTGKVVRATDQFGIGLVR
ncbi:MAG: hypothetical protein QOF78_1524 [Phycisphaerales bacterium]|jgi:hypothetical protein|nr:hypothetical protein [Phycisphaerales bacterium]